MLRRLFTTAGRQVVTLDYAQLISSRTLFDKIEQAYSPEGLGILFVKNIPQWAEKRAALLPLARSLALLPAEELQKLELAEVGYAVGWSHGKEKFMGQPDVAKGSFYANPENDYPKSKEGAYHQNVWPKQALPDLEPAFKGLGATLIKTGSLLARHIDKYVASKVKSYADGTLFNIVTKESANIGRLLHYYPRSGVTAEDLWCGWHNDHCALTGLTSSMYLKEDSGVEVPASKVSSPNAGLFIMARNREMVKAAIPADCAAFQIGETAEILSAGWLHATPHAVKLEGDSKGIGRNTFAVFMEPGPKYRLGTGPSADQLTQLAERYKEVPALSSRFAPNCTFGDFHTKTIKAYSSF
jgi:isopenicillin N synthase-like dioxygenase